jgi:cell division protein FtsZ
MFEIEESFSPAAVIKVIGVGGAGGNAVDHMIEAGIKGVEFICLNTDLQALARKKAPVKLQIGAQLTGGKGAGADPEVGRRAALESREAITEVLRGADMVFVAAGMGKGTGTGAAPVVAEIARSLGILTLPVVTRPFTAEGENLATAAQQGVEAFRKAVDSMLVIPNDRLLELAGRLPLHRAYLLADDTLRHAVQSIAEVIALEGQVNCDFNDVRTIMDFKGGIFMGMGTGLGDGCASRAAEQALDNPYLEDQNMAEAKGMLLNIKTKTEDGFTTEDLDAVLKVVRRVATRDCKIIYGYGYNPDQLEDLRVTVVATGMGKPEPVSQTISLLPSLEELPLRPAEQMVRSRFISDEGLSAGEDLEIPTFMRRKTAGVR